MIAGVSRPMPCLVVLHSVNYLEISLQILCHKICVKVGNYGSKSTWTPSLFGSWLGFLNIPCPLLIEGGAMQLMCYNFFTKCMTEATEPTEIPDWDIPKTKTFIKYRFCQFNKICINTDYTAASKMFLYLNRFNSCHL